MKSVKALRSGGRRNNASSRTDDDDRRAGAGCVFRWRPRTSGTRKRERRIACDPSRPLCCGPFRHPHAVGRFASAPGDAMSHETALIGTVAVGLALAFVFGFAAARLRIPPLVGYLLAG